MDKVQKGDHVVATLCDGDYTAYYPAAIVVGEVVNVDENEKYDIVIEKIYGVFRSRSARYCSGHDRNPIRVYLGDKNVC